MSNVAEACKDISAHKFAVVNQAVAELYDYREYTFNREAARKWLAEQGFTDEDVAEGLAILEEKHDRAFRD